MKNTKHNEKMIKFVDENKKNIGFCTVWATKGIFTSKYYFGIWLTVKIL